LWDAFALNDLQAMSEGATTTTGGDDTTGDVTAGTDPDGVVTRYSYGSFDSAECGR